MALESLFAQIFIELQKKIAADVPEVKWVDLDVGQLESYEVRPKVQFPCVLIDFPGATYSNLSQNVEWWDGNINIKLGFDPFSETSSITPDAVKFQGLEYFEIEHKLYKSLKSFTAAGNIQPMCRISAVTENRDDTFRVRDIAFTSAAEDEAAQTDPGTTAAGLLVENQIID